MAPEAIAPVRPRWPFWVFAALVLPVLLDAALLAWLGGAGGSIVAALTLALVGALVAAARTVRRMPAEGRVGWGVIGLLVAGAVAGALAIVAVVVIIALTCRGNCVS